MLTYLRTGQYYMNRGGPYAEVFPEVLRLSEGRYWVDYGYHLAPIQSSHLGEMEALATTHGVPSFKIFMFYGGYGLHGATEGDAQRRFLQLPEGDSYDLAHFEFVMRHAARVAARHPDLAPHVSVSLHCEVADILNAYTRLVRQDPTLQGLRAYSAARPPHSEGLGVTIAAYLAAEAECARVNLLHLSSRKAIEAARLMRQAFPRVNFGCEVTVGHLLLDYDVPTGALAKVNPPIRSREDVEFLWQAVLDRQVDWIVSDHACCATETKVARERPDDVWLAKAGFGGTEWLLSGVVSEGSRRGLSYARMAELTAWNPAQRYGLLAKGDIAPGIRRRPGARRPGADVHRPRRRLAVGPGVHAVRGAGAPRPGPGHVPAGRARVRSRPDRRPGPRPLPRAADAPRLLPEAADARRDGAATRPVTP